MTTTPGAAASGDQWWAAHQRGPLERVRLRDGSELLVGPLLKVDREPLAAWYETFSPRTKRRRFLGPQEHLTPRMLDLLVDAVDGIDHVALLAFFEDGEQAHVVGVARLVRLDAGVADVAVSVDDGWQGRGLATAMLPILLSRRPAGVTRLRTQVAEDNAASLAMLARVGTLRTVDSDSEVVEVEITLYADAGTLRDADGVD